MSKRTLEEENVCSFFLDRKKRHCRMKTLEGMSFCPHHSHLGSDQDPKKGCRVPCPYDSSHFCYESKLQKHLKICNAREKEKPEYFIENVNTEAAGSIITKLAIGDVPDEELVTVIHRIENLYNELHEKITAVTSMHPILKAEMEKLDDGVNTFKHLKQQAALLSVMKEHKLLQNGSCFVEFGAGKGLLMYWIVNCVPDSQKNAFILVDKSAQRHKSDSKFKGSDLQIQRIRIDIQNLYLGKVPSVKDKLDKIVGVSKHLCGGATDLAIKCMMNTLECEENGKKFKHKALGLLMALCCHHRCSWSTYIGKELMQKHGINEREFKVMCCMASWATCGLRKTSPVKGIDLKDEIQTDTLQDGDMMNRYQKLKLSHEEREMIGMKCKRLIDAGRVHYLRNARYDASLITYIEKSVSLENVALLAIYKGT